MLIFIALPRRETVSGLLMAAELEDSAFADWSGLEFGRKLRLPMLERFTGKPEDWDDWSMFLPDSTTTIEANRYTH